MNDLQYTGTTLQYYEFGWHNAQPPRTTADSTRAAWISLWESLQAHVAHNIYRDEDLKTIVIV
eukprot:scaffold153345_cov37-Tisochrysis_lutea.AAC.1